ncbi:MAG: hypothetical protein IT458_20270 [Planctomycetes bacterium]|nr:hypothetical protein [Planctomycetota bacterium]
MTRFRRDMNLPSYGERLYVRTVALVQALRPGAPGQSSCALRSPVPAGAI